MTGLSNLNQRFAAAVTAFAISFILFAGSVMPLNEAAMPYAGVIA
ncbi:hypothetical protein ACXYN8_04005 [Altererythrobacter sp. CAU 1778]